MVVVINSPLADNVTFAVCIVVEEADDDDDDADDVQVEMVYSSIGSVLMY